MYASDGVCLCVCVIAVRCGRKREWCCQQRALSEDSVSIPVLQRVAGGVYLPLQAGHPTLCAIQVRLCGNLSINWCFGQILCVCVV
jgi:hypothetical protein